MSDINIPGVTSKFNSDKIIEGLMKVERIPLERLEKQKELNNTKKKVWQNLNRKISSFRDSAKELYSYQNPFEDKKAESSDSFVLTASASRDAVVEKRSIKVIKTARTDKFISRPIEKNLKLESGEYIFKVGDEEITVDFRGGSLKSFSKILNREGSGILKSSIIKVDKDSVFFVLESKKTGRENKISFEKEALSFAEKTGIVKKQITSKNNINLSKGNIRQWTKPIDSSNITFENNILKIAPGSETVIPVTPAVSSDDKLVLEISLKVTNIPESEYIPPTPPQGPEIPETGDLKYEDITIKNESFKIDLPEWETPPPPEKVEDLQVLFLSDGENIKKLPEIKDTEEEQNIKIKLKDFAESIKSLNLRNRNTHKIISISSAVIYNPEARGDYTPVNAVSSASDAEIEIDGIKVTRSTNDIDDLIPGLTLNLKSESSRNVEIDVKPDNENIKNTIINFVGRYNSLLTEIQILTRNSQEIIDEIDYFSDEERESARERLGLLQGEISLTQLKSRLQRIMMNSYPWNEDKTLSMLSELGISTNSSGGGGLSPAKLRGYMEINEEKLDSIIESRGEDLKNLFGSDTDNDMVVDSGLAYTANTYTKGYSETGGIIALKIGTINRTIQRNEKDIENYNKKLEKTEQSLKRKYGMMEGALQEMEKSSKSLQNFNKNNNR